MIDLLICPDTIRKSKSSYTTQVFSEIYFQFDTNMFFPEKGWDDFTVIILNDWIQNTISCFYSGRSNCYFMDGSYKFSIDSKDELFYIEFFDDNKIIYKINIKKKCFFIMLKRSTNLVIRSLIQKNIATEETEKLQESFNDLNKLIQIKGLK